MDEKKNVVSDIDTETCMLGYFWNCYQMIIDT